MILIINFAPKEYHTLHDIARSTKDKEKPWQEKKLKTHFIAKSYERLNNIDKAEKLKKCGTFLEFKRFLTDNTLKLNSANFCKVRLCPLCGWRRSLKIFGQVSQIMNAAIEDKEHRFLFLTLTVKNCKGSELPQVINMMMNGYKYIFERSKVKKTILGSFRALEITHNTNRHSKSFDTYHPHFHCILMVNKSYFHKDYITQKEWVTMWQQSIKSEYQPIVHIENIEDSQQNIQKAVCEVAKYSVKDSDLLNADEELQDSAVKVLDESLINRRLVSFRGEFAKIQKKLKLDDSVDGDLVNCDNSKDELREDLNYILERYSWHIGYFQYIRLDENNNYQINSCDEDGVII